MGSIIHTLPAVFSKKSYFSSDFVLSFLEEKQVQDFNSMLQAGDFLHNYNFKFLLPRGMNFDDVAAIQFPIYNLIKECIR